MEQLNYPIKGVKAYEILEGKLYDLKLIVADEITAAILNTHLNDDLHVSFTYNPGDIAYVLEVIMTEKQKLLPIIIRIEDDKSDIRRLISDRQIIRVSLAYQNEQKQLVSFGQAFPVIN